MPTIKKLQFANGTDVTEPTDLSLESSTDHLKTYADDAAYEADNGAASAGDIYINTTMNTARLYAGGQWWSVVIKENAVIVDDNFKLVDNGDNTKVGKFDVSNVPTGQTKTFAVPAIATASDVLVTQDATQELKNKTIDGNLNTLTNLDFGTLSGEVNPQNGGTGISNPAGATLTRTGAFDLNITCTAETDITMPVSGTLATLDDIDVSNLTGTVAPDQGGLGTDASAFNGVVKADGAGNFSASAVTNTDISATAAIARSKVASGTANHIVINDGTGVLSSEATLAKSRGGSGQDNTNLTFPSTGTLATLAGSETLSSKTLLENTVDNFLAFNEEAAAPATPASGKVAVYAKSDSKIYKKDSTGAESEIGAGGSGTGRNYLQDWFDGTKPIGTIINGLTSTGNRSTSGGANLQWGASSTSNMTVTLETVTPLRQTSSIKIDSLNTTSGAFVETPMFLIDNADLGKPLSVEFDIGDIAANTNYDIVVMQYTLSGTYVQTIPVAGNASTGSPSSAQLPTGTTKFRGFFITAGDAGGYYYSLRIRKLAAVDDDFQIDSLFVGPQSLAQGAVVTEWQNYTTTLSAGMGGGTSTLQYRRVGSSIEIKGTITVGTVTTGAATFTLPSGITINTSLIAASGQNVLGYWSDLKASANIITGGWTGAVFYNGTNTLLGLDSTTNASRQFAGTNSNSLFASGDPLTVNCTVPVFQWSSGTTTLANRAVEEYAWNSNTANSNDLTSFAYGPDGAQFGSYSSATVTKRVRFQTPILPTDSIILEAKDGANPQWVPYHQSRYASLSSTTGMACSIINTTDVDVFFGASGYAATVYSGASAWSGVAGLNNYKWRLRKVSGGAAVGYPVSARNIVGDTSGTAVPAGYVGQEIVQSVVRSAQTAFTNGVARNITPNPLVLTSGVWELSANFYIEGGTGDTVAQAAIAISTTSATLPGLDTIAVPDSNGQMRNVWTGSFTNNGTGIQISPYRVIVSSSLTLYSVGVVAHSGGAANIFGSFRAIRIA